MTSQNGFRTLQHFKACLLLIISFSAASQTLDSPLPISPEITKGQLSNGLTYYIRENARPENKVELRLVVKAGSILEDDDQLGLAHFTEHMAFNGSKHFKKNELISFLQSIGVEFGADLNAQTGFDETIYILPVPTDKPGNLEKAFQALEDWASLVTFDGKEIDKERGIVLEESRTGKGADDRMNKVIYPKLFEGSKYAERLPIGKDEVLKKFKHDAIRRFYQDWYRPELMAVIVVGNIKTAQAEQMIKAHFEKLRNPPQPRPRLYAEVPGRSRSEGVVATDKEATNHVLQIYYSYKPAKREVTIGDYRSSIVKSIFNNLINLRLQERTQQKDPPFLYGATSVSQFVHGYEVFASFAVLSNGGVAPAINALMEESKRTRQFGFTGAELERVKKSFLRSLERAFNEREKTESNNYAEEYIRNFIDFEPIPGIANELEYLRRFSETITLEEINRYAATVIPTEDHKLVILTGPEQASFPIPSGEELLALANAAGNQNIKAYEEKVLASSLLDKVPVAGKVVSEKQDKILGITDITLSNGVRVLLKPTDFKNDQVLMGATRFGGQSLYEPADQFNAAYASTLVTQMGAGNFTPTDVRKVLAGKSVNAAPRLSVLSEGWNGQCGSTDIESMLQLVHLYTTQPRKDPELFASFVSKQKDYLQNIMSDPEIVYQDSLQKILYQHHPRAPRVPRSGDFDKIDVDRSLAIFKERLGNVQGLSFCFVGSFDLQKMKELVATYLGSLPSAEATFHYRDLGIRTVKGVVKQEVKKGKEAKSHVTTIYSGEAVWSEDAALRLQALIEVLNIKLLEKLREELSGVYGAGAYGQLSRNPYNNYMITVSIPCGPENVDKLIKATAEEIDAIKKNGPLAADLNKVKETWSKKYREDLKENSYWLSKLLQYVENPATAGTMLKGEERIKAITAKEIQEAANRYLDPANSVQVILNPEN
jgi:zinc protease